MALAASETGHLVLGTMNTPSAAKTIDRLIDLFPPGDQQQVRMTLAGGLHLIVGQRLVPAADGKGMVAAAELLPGSVALWSLIRDNKTFQIPEPAAARPGLRHLPARRVARGARARRARDARRRPSRSPRAQRSSRPHIAAKARPPGRAPPPEPPKKDSAACSARRATSSESEAPDMPRIDALFDALISAGGSDLHLGHRLPADDAPARRARRRCASEPIDPAEMEGLLFEITTPEQKRDDPRDARSRFRLRLRRQGALPRQLPLQDDRPRRGLPHHPEQGPDARRSRLPALDPAGSPSGARASCSSPARRAPASRRRSPR